MILSGRVLRFLIACFLAAPWCGFAAELGPVPLVATTFGDASPGQPYLPNGPKYIPSLSRDHFARAYLGNGLLGIRPNPDPLSQSETVAAGFVISHATGGFEMLGPAPYPLGADIRVGNRSVRADQTALRVERQTLDLEHGELVTRMNFDAKDGTHLSIEVTLFAVRTTPSLLCEQIEVTSDRGAIVDIVPQIDHEGLPGLVYRDQVPGGKKVASLALGVESDRHSRIGEAVVVVPAENVVKVPGGMFRLNLQAGKPGRFRSIASIVTSVYDPQPDLAAIRVASWGEMLGWDELRSSNRAAWKSLWKGRIVVDGDDVAQRALDSAFFYLHSSMHGDLLTGVAPFGMSQWSDYSGHVFWDMDSWDLPVAVSTDPAAARAMVLFRARGLEAAKRKAASFGMKGAMYPWEAGLDGSEQTPSEADTGWAEQHIVLDVAVGAWEYYEATGDLSTLRTAVWPILQGVAEWIADRGTFTKRGYEIRHVMGHNEWVEDVSNDSMVNLMSRMALRDAIRAAAIVGATVPPEWEKIEKLIYIPEDHTRAVIQPFSIDGPLAYYNESQNSYQRLSVSEHPEAYTLSNTQMLVFHDPPIPWNLYRNTWKYEESLRMTREPSPSVPGSVRSPGFSIPPLAACSALFGDRKKAAELFHLAATEYVEGPFDIAKEYRPYRDGAYVTNNASLLLAALYGFTGLRISSGDWRKYPVSLPDGWKRIEIDRIWIKGKQWHVLAEQGKPLQLTLAKDENEQDRSERWRGSRSKDIGTHSPGH
jgi:protein-glucosylgalactosylhydroxylysine glucosidase